MSTYVIGDLQGCLQQLKQLIKLTREDSPNPQWIFLGDLVNRGPSSLHTLRYIRSLGSHARVILGNHDLHLLAASLGIRRIREGDELQEVLDAPDREELLTWLRMQPLAIHENQHLFVHAGVLPQWSAETTRTFASEVETMLRSERWQDLLQNMYGDEPNQWDDALSGMSRLRCIINALTRLRFCTPDGKMEFIHAGTLDSVPQGYLPWFDAPERQTKDSTLVFGHWSALGLLLRPNLISLDTGCVWGGQLTALRLADRKLFHVDCPPHQALRPTP